MKTAISHIFVLLCAACMAGCTDFRIASARAADVVPVDPAAPYDSLFEYGEQLMDRSEFVEATDHFLYLIRTVDSTDLERHSDCLSELSVCYLRRGMFAEAFSAATRVIELDERLGDPERLIYSLNTLGSLYALNRQPVDAEKYIRRSLDIAVQLHDSVKMAGRNGTLSEVLLSQNRTNEALAAANEAVRLDSLRCDTARMAVRLVQKASVLEAMERLNEARALLDVAQPVLRSSGNATSLAICLNQLGSIALKQERWTDAQRAYDEALAISLRTGNRNGQVKSHLGLWKALRTTDAERAADHLEAYSLLRDSLFQEGTLQVMADYDARYELERLQQQERRHQRLVRSLTVGAVVLAIVLIVTVFFQLRSARRRNQRVRQWQEKYLALEAATATGKPEMQEMQEIPDKTDSPENSDNPASSARPATPPRDPFMIRFDELLDHQMQNLEVDMVAMADALRVTRTQLSRRVKDLEGITLREYVARYRTEKACMLLGRGDLKVADVARACGFDDFAYFSRFFRRETGMAPSEFVSRRS